jgi:hypothetical protein
MMVSIFIEMSPSFGFVAGRSAHRNIRIRRVQPKPCAAS